MNRIVIIGSTGSGNTTLAHKLGEKLGCPAIDLDQLFWLPGWVEREPDDFREKTQEAASGNRWVAAGNYRGVRDILWNRADMLIWLDYSFPRTFWQLTYRSFLRLVKGTVCCNGNKESIRKLCSKDSIILWLFTSYAPHRREYLDIFEKKPYPNIRNYIRLRAPSATRKFIAGLK